MKCYKAGSLKCACEQISLNLNQSTCFLKKKKKAKKRDFTVMIKCSTAPKAALTTTIVIELCLQQLHCSIVQE